MTFFTYFAVVLSVASLIGYFNYRFLNLQPTIAAMGSTLLIGLVILVFNHFVHHHQIHIEHFVKQIHFRSLVMNVMLPLLLFAGGLTLDLSHIKNQKIEIGILATLSTILSAVFIGCAMYWIMPFIGLKLSLLECFLFGSLISPTDPVAVLAIFKKLKAPKSLSTLISAESLYNDGVAIVLFTTLYSLTYNGTAPTFLNVSTLFLHAAVGGVFFGLCLGWLGYHILNPIHDIQLEMLITLTIAFSGYTLAQSWGLSGPIAMVTSGIVIGSSREKNKSVMSRHQNLLHFWELIDDLLNILLFLLLGFELLTIPLRWDNFLAALIAIVITLIARYTSVHIPALVFKKRRGWSLNTVNILTWGGLRGGLAVALVLSLPSGLVRDNLLTLTYVVVVFSILVQGTTVEFLLPKSNSSPSGMKTTTHSD